MQFRPVKLQGSAAVLPPAAAPQGPMLRSGLLVFELALPLRGTVLLLDGADAAGGLSLIHAPDLGFGLMHRQGARLLRHRLAGADATGNGTAELRFAWEEDGRWSMEFLPAEGTTGARVAGRGALPLRRVVLEAACLGSAGQVRSPALLRVGTSGGPAPGPLARLGPRTPIATPAGMVAAGALRAGDVVLTRDAGPCALVRVTRQDLPGEGRFAPVRLRAPFFGATTDLLVSADQPVRLDGVDVEYLFGEDEVLVAARHLIDGNRAMAVPRAALLPWITLDLGKGAVLVSGGAGLAVGAAAARQIDGFEARALIAMRRTGATRSAA